MIGVIRKKQVGQAWETVLDTGNGGSSPGIWKEWGIDSSNGPFADIDITVGDGQLTAKWWTPAAVAASPDTDPFLCSIFVQLVLGSTSEILGNFGVFGPIDVDGETGIALGPAGNPPLNFPLLVSAVIGGEPFAGYAVGFGTNGNIYGLDATLWSPTVPDTWDAGDSFTVTATFMAQFIAD